MPYRPEIDGLRAVSVALVFAFHLGLIGGGFVGVDVFFVISGYLITGIIHAEVERGAFSFKAFYERRARRILPALMVMVLAVAVCGYVLLYPGDYETFGRSALYAIVGLSNVFFFNHTGYFDLPSQNIPLLHTWSLGVEEQFYVLWPVLILLGHRIFGSSKAAWRGCLIAVAALSFAGAMVAVSRDPKAAFYLPFTRAWELALGALIVFLPAVRGRVADALPPLGLALIAATAVFLDASAPFPGMNALPPVIGALLIVWPASTISGRLLGRLAPLGLISYSLYLWHWPVIVFWRQYQSGAPLSGVDMLSIVAVSIGLAVASYILVERPFRRIRFRGVLRLALAAEVVAAIMLVPIVWTSGFPARIPANARELGSKDEMWAWPCTETKDIGLLSYPGTERSRPTCIAGLSWATARHHALVWGDSNAESVLPFLSFVAARHDTSIALVNACIPIIHEGVVQRYWPELPTFNSYCEASRAAVLRLINGATPIDLVVLAAAWSTSGRSLVKDGKDRPIGDDYLRFMARGFDDLLPRLRNGRRVVIFGDVPKWRIDDPVSCLLAEIALPRRPCAVSPKAIPRATFDTYQRAPHDALRSAAIRFGVTSYSPEDYLCDDQDCRTTVDGEYLYRDGGHFRRNFDEKTLADIVGLMHLDALFEGLPASLPQKTLSTSAKE